jgi:hypothetical protein
MPGKRPLTLTPEIDLASLWLDYQSMGTNVTSNLFPARVLASIVIATSGVAAANQSSAARVARALFPREATQQITPSS